MIQPAIGPWSHDPNGGDEPLFCKVGTRRMRRLVGARAVKAGNIGPVTWWWCSAPRPGGRARAAHRRNAEAPPRSRSTVRVAQRVEERFAARVRHDDDSAHAAVAEIVDGIVDTLLAIDIDDEQACACDAHARAWCGLVSAAMDERLA